VRAVTSNQNAVLGQTKITFTYKGSTGAQSCDRAVTVEIVKLLRYLSQQSYKRLGDFVSSRQISFNCCCSLEHSSNNTQGY